MREKGSVASLLGRRVNGRAALATGLTLDFARVLQLGRGVSLLIACGRFRGWPVLPAGLSSDAGARVLAAGGCLGLRQSGECNHGQYGNGTSKADHFGLPCFYCPRGTPKSVFGS